MLENDLNEQRSQIDPFSQALTNAKMNVNAQPGYSTDFMNYGNISKQENNMPTNNTIKNILDTYSSATDYNLIKNSKIPGMLKELGMNNAIPTLAFTQLGKANLMNNFRKQFGDDFMNNQKVQKVISMFDDYLLNNKQDTMKAQYKSESEAKRILSAIGNY